MASMSSTGTGKARSLEPRFARLDEERREQVVRLLMELLEHSWEEQPGEAEDGAPAREGETP